MTTFFSKQKRSVRPLSLATLATQRVPTGRVPPPVNGATAAPTRDLNSFKLGLDYIKALPVRPICIQLSYQRWYGIALCCLLDLDGEKVCMVQGGQETDFILVSCSGAGVDLSRREQVLKAKQVGPPFHFRHSRKKARVVDPFY